MITDLCHVFGCEEAVYGMGVFMSGAGPHFPKFPYDIVRIHTLMIYSDIVEYNIVGDTKAALLRCIPFISKIKKGDIISTGQYMNYQNFPNQQFKKILKNSFHSIKLELRDSYGEKIPFNSVGVTRAVQKSFRQSFPKLSLQKMVADSDLPYFRGYSRQRGRGFGALAQTIGRTAIPFLRRYVVRAAKRVGADLIELAAPEIGNV